jgi:hypothetical protein
MKEDEVGATCGTNGTEFVQRCGRKTLWKETHELSMDRWEDKTEMDFKKYIVKLWKNFVWLKIGAQWQAIVPTAMNLLTS